MQAMEPGNLNADLHVSFCVCEMRQC